MSVKQITLRFLVTGVVSASPSASDSESEESDSLELESDSDSLSDFFSTGLNSSAPELI